MSDFPARLVTPERVLLDEPATAVVLRTDVGDATFLAGHTALIGALVPGLVRFEHEGGTTERSAVHGGFVHVAREGVTVLAPVAELARDIDVERARRALEAAEQAAAEITGRASGPEDDATALELAEAEAAAQRARVRLEVAEA
ncbi:MAG TPA: ATP synthase F1 subunit epsilon [Acidimicrobiales bacterium]|nr:ATP synthase F1 subunit epsilon [Acidimicrobiales bacterium]